MLPEIIDRNNFQERILPAYQNALEWLDSFITDPAGHRYDMAKPYEQRLLEYRQQFERTKKFLEFLGNPQEQFPSIHIAGTGGKGSVSMIIGKILQASDNLVGIHTKPYLQTPLEKFLINGKMIAPSRFIKLVNDLQEKCEQFRQQFPEITLQYSELWTLLYNLYFAQNDLDWGVIETNMGGRFDPSNVRNSELALITNIDFDHIPQLGTSLEEIAWHKSGIIKPGKPVITGEQKEEPLAVIRQEAAIKKAKLYSLGDNFFYQEVSRDNKGVVINVIAPYHNYRSIRVPLLGPFQAGNTTLAIVAADVLGQQYPLPLSSELINERLENLKFKGRVDIVQVEPTVILDGAHNPQKIAALAEAMRQQYPDKKFTLIYGMLGHKSSPLAVAPLLGQAEKVIVVRPSVYGKPGMEIQKITEAIKSTGFQGQTFAIPEVN